MREREDMFYRNESHADPRGTNRLGSMRLPASRRWRKLRRVTPVLRYASSRWWEAAAR